MTLVKKKTKNKKTKQEMTQKFVPRNETKQ